MALVFHRRLAIPLWALAFFTVAITAPTPVALSMAVILGIAVIALTRRSLAPSLRALPSVAQRLLTGKRRTRCAAPAEPADARARTYDTPHPTTAQDALDLVRMDDDGGWQMARPSP